MAGTCNDGHSQILKLPEHFSKLIWFLMQMKEKDLVHCLSDQAIN